MNITLEDGTLKNFANVDSITEFRKTLDKKFPTWSYLNYFDRTKNEVKHIDRYPPLV